MSDNKSLSQTCTAETAMKPDVRHLWTRWYPVKGMSEQRWRLCRRCGVGTLRLTSNKVSMY